MVICSHSNKSILNRLSESAKALVRSEAQQSDTQQSRHALELIENM